MKANLRFEYIHQYDTDGSNFNVIAIGVRRYSFILVSYAEFTQLEAHSTPAYARIERVPSGNYFL